MGKFFGKLCGMYEMRKFCQTSLDIFPWTFGIKSLDIIRISDGDNELKAAVDFYLVVVIKVRCF